MNQTDSLATPYNAGIDLHKKNFMIHIRDTRGKEVYRKCVRKHKRKQLLEIVEPFKDEITIGLESTYNWYWLHDTLTFNNYPCKLGHALYLSRQKMDKNKNDTIDAADMSDLLRVGRFPEAYACDAEHRSVRDLMRLRVSLMQNHTSYVLRGQCIGDQYLMSEDSLAAAGYRRETIADIDLSLAINMEMQEELIRRIERLDKYIIGRAKIHDRELYELLTAVDGIGPVTALTILYETGDIERFKGPQKYSSYCRLVRPQCDSAGKRVGVGHERNGNPYLSYIFNSLAILSKKNNPIIATWYTRLKKKRKERTVRRVLAHKWAVTVFFMLKRREAFDLEKFLGTTVYAKIKAATDSDTV